jgi:hypothetical protein
VKKNNILTKILAIAGTVLVWFPILAPVLLGAISFMADGIFRFDYLMPAELFPSILVGGGLLIWAAIRARLQLKVIAWGFGIAVLGLFGSQGLAVLTGLASGANEATGWRLVLVAGLLAVYGLAVIVIGVGGILLWRDLFKRANRAASAS